jgi:hypothetical protein
LAQTVSRTENVKQFKKPSPVAQLLHKLGEIMQQSWTNFYRIRVWLKELFTHFGRFLGVYAYSFEP